MNGRWRTLAGLLRPWRVHMAVVIGLVLVGAALDLAPPLLVKRILDRHLVAAHPEGLLAVAGWYLLAVAAAQANGLAVNWLTAIVAESALRDLRVRLMDRLIRLPQAFFDRAPTGDLISRATSDVDAVDTLFSWGLVSVIGDCCGLVTSAVAMAALNRRLALAAALVVPVVAGVTAWFRSGVRAAEREGRRSVGRVNARLQETLGGMEVIRSFGGERTFAARVGRELDGMLRAMNRSTLYSALYSPMMALLSAAAASLLLWRGASIGAGPTIGTLAAFILLFQKFFDPIVSLGDDWQTVQGALSGYERIEQILAEPEEPRPAGEPAATPDARRPVVEATDVRFGYREDREILHGVSLRIAAGEHVALVGRTGSGKTSLLALLTGAYAPWGGRVRLGGRDPRAVPDAERRRAVGLVPQTPQLFSESVRENLTLGDPGVEDGRLRRAVADAGADRFVAALPGGYDAVVGGIGGGTGVNLSAGQRQLLALARALAGDPPFLALDEATSAVDAETDAAIRHALAPRLAAGCGVLTVAHRLSTACAADRIVVLEAGRVVEEGSPDDLIRRGGRFAALLELERAGWDWRKD